MDRYSSTLYFIYHYYQLYYIYYIFFSPRNFLYCTHIHIRSKATPCVVRPTSRRMLCRLFETLHRQLNMQSTHKKQKDDDGCGFGHGLDNNLHSLSNREEAVVADLHLHCCCSTAPLDFGGGLTTHFSYFIQQAKVVQLYSSIQKKKFKITALNFFFLHLLIQF